MSIEQQHRSGPLKQQNKKHKTGRHKSKGQIEVLKKGKVNANVIKKRRKLELNREEKRNQANQLRKQKREEFLEKRRGISEAPFLVAVVPLNSSINGTSVLESLKIADSDASISETPEGHVHISVPRWKQRFTFVVVDNNNLFDTLDILKAATTVIFLTPVIGLDEEGKITLSACLAQGLPSTIVVATDIADVPIKKRQDLKNQLRHEISKWLPDEKIMGLDKESDGLTILRRIGSQKVKAIKQRDLRPHLLADHVEFIEIDPGKGRVSLSGYLRGATLSVNSLIHIPGWGDFKMSAIDVGPSYDQLTLLEKANPNFQSLESENPVNPMDAEQTWPTSEDFEDAEKERKKIVKRVPKGFSDYQAAWIPDNDAFNITDSEDESDDEDMKDEAVSDDDSSCYEDAESTMDDNETVFSEIHPDKYDSQIDFDEEKDELEKIRKAKEDKEFPDEVDTPLEIPARDRFAKYRGLLSFRTTPWDPKENLPANYARIFQFKNFTRTKKEVLKTVEECNGGAHPGCYIRVHVENVPSYLLKYRDSRQPIVLFGLLQHEQKMSVINMLLKRLPEDSIPLKSKENLLLQCGYRRYKAAPVFSQHTTGNKHKYERFFHPDSTAVATTYAPIIFPPSSVLAFKENRDGSVSLVATGSVLSVSPDRLVIKRTVLSGHPFKVNKRSAVIRFMFFNREDINWFKPVELRTKFGRRGHIKEPLGTHGHMKCVFNGQLKSQDTILLHLYKRVYPKWTYNPNVTFTKVFEPQENENMEED